MLPPRPPSPPSGPPRGTYFSRRKLTAPSPPLPAWTEMRASSTNFMLWGQQQKSPIARIGLRCWEASLLCRDHAHDLLRVRALCTKLDPAGDLREERVIAPHADVRTRVHLGATLPHDDAPGWDDFAAVTLHAEPFRLGVAAVPRASACLLVCHLTLRCVAVSRRCR